MHFASVALMMQAVWTQNIQCEHDPAGAGYGEQSNAGSAQAIKV